MTRDEQIIKVRPVIDSIDIQLVNSDGEKFQNQVLRPIIKFQHELLIVIFNDYLLSKKIDLESFSDEIRMDKVDVIFKKDKELVSQLKSVIVGFFTSKECEIYFTMKSEINKRMIQIVRERIISVIF